MNEQEGNDDASAVENAESVERVRELIRDINPTLKMWFARGRTDPDLVLVHVESIRASF